MKGTKVQTLGVFFTHAFTSSVIILPFSESLGHAVIPPFNHWALQSFYHSATRPCSQYSHSTSHLCGHPVTLRVCQSSTHTQFYKTLTIFVREDRLHVVVHGVREGNGCQYADDGSEGEHESNHHSSKIHCRHRIQHHCRWEWKTHYNIP